MKRTIEQEELESDFFELETAICYLPTFRKYENRMDMSSMERLLAALKDAKEIINDLN